MRSRQHCFHLQKVFITLSHAAHFTEIPVIPCLAVGPGGYLAYPSFCVCGRTSWIALHSNIASAKRCFNTSESVPAQG